MMKLPNEDRCDCAYEELWRFETHGQYSLINRLNHMDAIEPATNPERLSEQELAEYIGITNNQRGNTWE